MARMIDYSAFHSIRWLEWTYNHLYHAMGIPHARPRRVPCLVVDHESTRNRDVALDWHARKWYCHRCNLGGNALTLFSLITGLGVYRSAMLMCELAGEPIPYLDLTTDETKSALSINQGKVSIHSCGIKNLPFI